MTGNIMSASEAVEKYGTQYSSIRRVGDMVEMKNSTGKIVRVRPGSRIYHRGHMKDGGYV
jgi:hypothetical protein